jgi:hypothetical protein
LPRWRRRPGEAGPDGLQRGRRLVIATPDPATFPGTATWYLETTLPHAAAGLTEVVRLYGLWNWVEQAYKQIKGSLGWSQYQVRSDRAIRRHWALVPCTFAFCWWAETRSPPVAVAALPPEGRQGDAHVPAGERGGKVPASPHEPPASPVALLARGAAAGAGLVGAGLGPLALLADVVGSPPALTAGPAGLAAPGSSPLPL